MTTLAWLQTCTLFNHYEMMIRIVMDAQETPWNAAEKSLGPAVPKHYRTELAILCDRCRRHDAGSDMSTHSSSVWVATGATPKWRHTKFSHQNLNVIDHPQQWCCHHYLGCRRMHTGWFLLPTNAPQNSAGPWKLLTSSTHQRFQRNLIFSMKTMLKHTNTEC